MCPLSVSISWGTRTSRSVLEVLCAHGSPNGSQVGPSVWNPELHDIVINPNTRSALQIHLLAESRGYKRFPTQVHSFKDSVYSLLPLPQATAMVLFAYLILSTSLCLTSHLAQAYLVRTPQWALSAEETDTLVPQVQPRPLPSTTRVSSTAGNDEASLNDGSNETNDDLVIAPEAESQILSDLTNVIDQAGEEWAADFAAIYNAIADLLEEVSTDASKINQVHSLTLSTPMSAEGWQRLYTTCALESECEVIERLDHLHEFGIPRRSKTGLQTHGGGICAGGPLMLQYSISTTKAAGLTWLRMIEGPIYGATGVAIGLVHSSLGDVTAIIEC